HAGVRRYRDDHHVHARGVHRGHDRDRRIARLGDGRGRPVSLYEEIQEVRARYPEGARSAVLPALRLAQEEHGWLSPDAIREVADALDLTPGYCHAVASFYDTYHLAPTGRLLVAVGATPSCART